MKNMLIQLVSALICSQAFAADLCSLEHELQCENGASISIVSNVDGSFEITLDGHIFLADCSERSFEEKVFTNLSNSHRRLHYKKSGEKIIATYRVGRANSLPYICFDEN